MAEPVRLVVWDLDETFWRGTLVEGGIREYVQAHHDIVVELARRGILSSICSKNDEQSVVKILEERKILDYFVFPDISWDPKGPRLAALIEAVQLRPATVMFIDDNPHNLAEARAFIPDLQLENEKFIPKLLADPRFVGKDDSGLSRLKQYKLMEGRHEAQRSAGGGGQQFLRDSDIRVCFDHDLEDVANLDRAIELINRTNQLNYTKRRLPEDLEAARSILRQDTADMGVQAGLIRVVDRYGDYGYVGFFMMRTNIELADSRHRELVHFCFSCRTLGMLVERWVYDYLERPKLDVVGEVVSDLSGPDEVDWVRLVSSSELFSDRKAEVAAIAPELRLWGGCEMYPIGLYLKQYVPEVKVRGSFVANNKFILLNSCALAVSAFDRTESEFSDEAKALGVPADVLAGDYFADAPPGTAIVFSGGLDGGRFSDVAPYYQHARHGWELAFELAGCFDVTTLPEGTFERLVEDREGCDERTRVHLTEVARHVRRNYRTAPPMSDGRRAAALRALLEHVPVGAKLILLLDHDRQRVQGVVEPDPRTAHYNELVRRVVDEYPYAQTVCFSDFVHDDEQVQELGNHYHRVVYLKLAERLAELIDLLPLKRAPDQRSQKIVDAEATDWSNVIEIERPKDWDEKAYLRENPDLVPYMGRPETTDGWAHFARFGYLEKRAGVPPKIFDYVQSYSEATIKPAAPPRLRKRVNGDDNLQLFESMGRTVAANVFGQLMRVGPYGKEFKILDFGVGCGRVLRPLHELCLDAHLTDGKLRWFGSDIDAEAITWCKSVLEPIGTFVVNSPMPPLPFDKHYFDFVYSTSIFTHLPEDMQFAWLSELRRVMRIGSFAVLSTHPTDLMPAFLKDKLRDPEFHYQVAGDTEGLPSFYQVAFHSHKYINKKWSEYFAIRKIIPNGIGKRQDLVLCQRVA